MACTVSPLQVYRALIKAGFSTVQAIGIIANGIAESGLNPEAAVMDSNGFMSYGIWQFNAKSYPNAASLVTGNCPRDLAAQVGLVKASASGQALAGSTGGQVAGNFARYFERCATCQPGGASYKARVANAATVAKWAASGKWPASTSTAGVGGGGSAAAAAGSSPAAAGSDCAFSLGGGHLGLVFGHGPSLPSSCLIRKSEIRGLLGGLLMVAGGGVFVVGALIVAAGAFQRSGAVAAVGRVRSLPGVP